VSGSITKIDTDTEESVSGGHAEGVVVDGTDIFEYTGEFNNLNADARPTVTIDGDSVNPEYFGYEPSQPDSQPISFGTEYSGELTDSNTRDRYTFNAKAGEYIRAMTWSGAPEEITATIYGPDGNALDSFDVYVETMPVGARAPKTGEHTIEFSGNPSTPGYTFTVTKSSADTMDNSPSDARQLTDGETRTGTAEENDDGDYWAIDAPNSETLTATVDAETFVGATFTAEFIAPDGTRLDSQQVSCTPGQCRIPAELSAAAQESGTYYVKVSGGTEGYVDYSVTANAPNTETHRIKVSSDGERINYDFDVSGTVEKVDTDTEESVSGGHAEGVVVDGTDVFEFTGSLTDFAADGCPDVVVDGRTIPPSQLNCKQPDPSPTAISLGTTYSGDVSDESSSDTYTFRAENGEYIRTKMISYAGGETISATLYAPDGTELSTSNLYGEEYSFGAQAPTTGKYTLKFTENQPSSGEYEFVTMTATDSTGDSPSQARSLPDSTTKTDILGTNDADYWAVDVPASGDLSVTVDHESYSGAGLTVEIFGPDGTVLQRQRTACLPGGAGQCAPVEFSRATTSTGTHYIRVRDASNNYVKYAVTANAPETPNTSTPMTVGKEYSGEITRSESPRRYTFTANKGEYMRLSVRAGTGGKPTMTVYGPDGERLIDRTELFEDDMWPYAIKAPSDGEYTVEIEMNADKGPYVYGLRLWKASPSIDGVGDTRATAQQLHEWERPSATIFEDGKDYWKVDVQNPGQFTVTVANEIASTEIALDIINPDGDVIAHRDVNCQPDPSTCEIGGLSATADSPGTYYAVVSDKNITGFHTYSISTTLPEGSTEETHRFEISSNRQVDYEFDVTGMVTAVNAESGDSVSDGHVEGAVNGGTDTFEYTGKMMSLDVSGGATASVDGTPLITAGSTSSSSSTDTSGAPLTVARLTVERHLKIRLGVSCRVGS